MCTNVKSKFNLPRLCSRKSLLLVSLLFMIVLVFSCFVSVFSGVSLFTLGAPNVTVSNETELINAVNNSAGATTITLNNDISLSYTLNITAGKGITLTSNRLFGFYKLIGVKYQSTLTVEDSGVLTLDGIIVTHEEYVEGRGVTINSGGKLVLLSGEISGNMSPTSFGPVGGPSGSNGGVFNQGVFEMYGGKISNNKAVNGAGGGVGNLGIFEMYGGEISNNSALSIISTNAWGAGGGVSNGGTFSMYGGEISNNRVDYYGGGVYNYGPFSMSGGKISGNTAGTGGGVYTNSGSFDRQSGVISGNTVTNKDGEGKDVYIYNSSGGGSSSGNGGSSGGNDGSSNGNNGPSNGNSWPTEGSNGPIYGSGGFSSRDVVFICICVIMVTVVHC